VNRDCRKGCAVNGSAGVWRSGRSAVARRDAVGMAARWGFAARGVLYLLVGVLAVRIAFGDGGEEADRGGAVQQIARQPFGGVLLWALGLGLAGMAVWRLSQAAGGAPGRKDHAVARRVGAGARAVFYAATAYSVFAFTAGHRQSGSDRKSRDVTATVLGWPLGQELVVAAGCALAAAGVWIAVRAARCSFRDRLKRWEMSPRARRVTDVLGVVGGAARGITFAAAGVFAVKAGITFDPGRARGLDATLRSFRHAPAGPWLLVTIAVGLALFGAFSFAMARWRRT
jgi:Domain of Unknown Function (DUF1206)